MDDDVEEAKEEKERIAVSDGALQQTFLHRQVYLVLPEAPAAGGGEGKRGDRGNIC